MEDIAARLQLLLNKSEWTEEEKTWLQNYLEQTEASELESLMQHQFEEKQLQQLDRDVSNQLLHHIHESINQKERVKKAGVHRIGIFRIIAAAAIIGVIILGIYFTLNGNGKETILRAQKIKPYQNNVLPGSDKAVLTLADGSTIALGNTHTGILTRQGGTKVVNLNGTLAYSSTSSAVPKEVLYNTVSIPLGGQYQVALPDGSHVWLNAASSLHFPTAFVGKDRRVEITGEAYFEVAKDKIKPFIVSVNGAEIQVLGTHFNVMAYTDETTIKTTLLEGAVKFSKGATSNTLLPGQQSQLTTTGQIKVIDGVNVDEVVAWKDGFFRFEGTDIGTITRQLSRWYGIEVVYKQKLDDLFYAEIPRNTNLADALKVLELTGKVHFKIDGRKIIVMR
jgi:transmembrane sensor